MSKPKSAETLKKTFSHPSPQSEGRQPATRSGRLVSRKNITSGRCRIIRHASSRHRSASSRKKSDVMQIRSCSPLLILIATAAGALQRIIEIPCPIYLPAVCSALTVKKVHIAISATFACFHASMPRIPDIVHFMNKNLANSLRIRHNILIFSSSALFFEGHFVKSGGIKLIVIIRVGAIKLFVKILYCLGVLGKGLDIEFLELRLLSGRKSH